MVQLSLIKPIDQPPGTRRLLAELKEALGDSRFTDFRIIVAYAKSGPLHRLRDLLERWRELGKRTEAVFGVDQQGTSRQALELALELFHAVYVTREPGVTFHPKVYLFKGTSAARCFVGSNNLTVGGTETNFEAAVRIDLDFPADTAAFAALEDPWTALLPAACAASRQLDGALLAKLVADGDVLDEQAMRAGDGVPNDRESRPNRGLARSGLLIKPASPLPRRALTPTRSVDGTARSAGTAGSRSPAAAKPPTAPAASATAQGLAIQIKPHHNGEIFLSVSAALQNPAFFRWPFTGRTTPKKADNPSYPQLNPDPVVNVTVYGAVPAPILTLSAYKLNTVYYEKKSEIRITASPLVHIVPEYSVMIMRTGEQAGIDYDITIHRPDSPDYAAWVAACNQTMPSGGQAPRKFGWF